MIELIIKGPIPTALRTPVCGVRTFDIKNASKTEENERKSVCGVFFCKGKERKGTKWEGEYFTTKATNNVVSSPAFCGALPFVTALLQDILKEIH